MIEYQSLSHFATVEIEDKKSRFIGFAKPIQSIEEAEEFVEEIKNKHKDATHHVFAWKLHKPQQMQRFSDDGEPQGTAGMPVYDVLMKRNITQAIIVVVRYFGGIKLGAGGLVRCYSKAASLAVEEAKPIKYLQHQMYSLRIDYANADKLRYQLDQYGYHQTDPQYQEDVSWDVAVKKDETESFIKCLKDITNDSVQYKKGDLQEFPISI